MALSQHRKIIHYYQSLSPIMHFRTCKHTNYAYLNNKGTTTLHLGTQNKGSHSIKSKTGNESIEVETIDLDNLLKELKINSIDLLKIDVEGAEPEVIEGSIEF